MYRLKITDRAEAEYKKAYWFYEDRQPGLGDRYEAEAEKLIQLILENPRLFPRKYKRYREGLMKRFPFFIVYEITVDTIILHSFFHTSQNPKKKHGKNVHSAYQ